MERSEPPVAQTPEPTKPLRPNLVLGICCLSILLVGMDVTIVNVALPSIQRSLHATLSGLQWIVDAYTLVVASLLMLSGSMSDRYGRLRVFQIGLTLFTTGSLLCSLAPGIGSLVAARVLQGLGASMLNPVALSIIANVFPDPKGRARAVGVWGAVSGLSMALGPVIGGALTQTVGWRSIFWINIPIGIAAVILGARFVPESKAAKAKALDPVGQILVVVGLASLIYALIEGPRAGWTSPTISGLFAIAASSLAIFLVFEPRRKEPLLDLRFFRSVNFSSAAVLALGSFSSFAALLFLNALYLQQVRGFSAFRTGLCTLPLAIMMTLAAPLSGRLVGNYGSRPSLVVAGTSLALSGLILTQLDSETSIALLLLAYGLFGFGLGMVNPAISDSAVAGMPLSQAGVAAGIASTCRQVGAATGVAVAGTVVTQSRAQGSDFGQATHPIWWIVVACGFITIILGWISNLNPVKAREAKLRFQLEA
jgi:EmrB/QacA subfamily drug resistance transporter